MKTFASKLAIVATTAVLTVGVTGAVSPAHAVKDTSWPGLVKTSLKDTGWP